MSKKKVLVIEDEENIAKAHSMILEDKFDVHLAMDGEEGLKKAKELKPDLIILDLMMPKRNGYDVCFNIRQDKEIKDTRIIMVTAKNQDIDEDKGMMIGADDYIMKPFEAEELLYVIGQLMDKNKDE